jgi:hypothetical protein
VRSAARRRPASGHPGHRERHPGDRRVGDRRVDHAHGDAEQQVDREHGRPRGVRSEPERSTAAQCQRGPGDDQRPKELTNAAETCLLIAIHGFAPFDNEVRHHYRMLVLRQLAIIRHRLDPTWLNDVHSRIRDAPDAERKERAQLIDLAAQIVPPEANRQGSSSHP